MKTLFATLLLISSPVFSQTSAIAFAVVEASFWQAPAKTSATIHLQANNAERLAKACKRFKREMIQLKDEGNSRFNRDYADRLRKRPHLNDTENDSFADYFTIKSSELNFQNHFELKQIKSIPHYNHNDSVQNIKINDFLDFAFESSDDSMLKISEFFELGIQFPKVISRSAGDAQIEVDSLDLACDLYEGKVKFFGTLSSDVRLVQKSVTEIENFYQFHLLQAFSSIYKMNLSDSQKALLLGFRLNELFTSESRENNRDEIEASFINTISKIVNVKDFTPSDLLYFDNGRYFIDSRLYQANQPIHVTVEGESL